MVIIWEIEQGSSSSIHDHNDKRYDVFLSFRGADTRLRFTAHLYDALIDANVDTFLDDEDINTGEDLKPELEDAIRSSRASVIVLSENYATSTWCLDELALILDQRLTSDHIVIPIFYHVEPTDVRKQQNSFKTAMAEHRQKMEAETNAEKRVNWGEKIDRWCKALTDVANLKGKDIKGRKETQFIEEIVIEIRQRLGVPLSDSLPLLIGRYRQIDEITSWLTDGSSSLTADILTVLGMGGIGKTSLARYVFHLHSRAFPKSCFIEGINSKCTEKFDGLLDVQKQLYDVITKKKKPLVHDPHVYPSKIEKALSRVKVFLVLDDIDSLNQLDALLGNKGFHPGSKIIITTRDASLTERCALFKSEVECKHTTIKIEGLYKSAGQKLLRLHAFNCRDPQEGYEEVIEKLVKYCEGHPLALEVLGKSLYNRDIAYWEACVENLKNETHSCIRRVLQMSFESLPFHNDKELFKHIACFFVGRDREISEKILKACDINTVSGIPNLIERCLISIDQWDNSLKMHQLLQEMGKAIVREESPDHPGKRSRLWCHDESFIVLKRKKGTESLKGLVFDKRMLEKHKFCDLKADAFSSMDNLMILQLNYVQLIGSYENFPEELRWLCLQGFPLKSIPLDIPMEKLVVLDMSYSKIKSFVTCCTSCNSQPFEGGQKLIGSCSKDERILGSLKILHLSFCEHLHKLGCFYELPKLERLIARNCIRLIEICESFEDCAELCHIDLSYCVKLEKIPRAIHKLKKDFKLFLDGCNTHESILQELVYSAISFTSSLVSLSLANNNLTNESFPMDWSCLSRLKYLCLDENPIVSMPNCVRSLCWLEELSMKNCKTLLSIEHPPRTLKQLDVKMFEVRSDNKPLLQRISFDPDMSPISIAGVPESFQAWSYEIEGMVKIQPLEGVEEKVLCSLGWTNLSDFLDKTDIVRTYNSRRGKAVEQFQIQMYYEFGIFSTVYGGQVMPDWNISIHSHTPISFTIPSIPNKQLRGLNFCYVERWKHREDPFGYPLDRLSVLPTIEMINKTKNRTWIYKHCNEEIDVGGEWLTFLSHWMFGMNDMEGGDKIIIYMIRGAYTIEEKVHQGVCFLYEDDEGSTEDEDVLEYYKSWNHIIGGDLSPFEETTGQYYLWHHKWFLDYRSPKDKPKNTGPSFRAFSKRRSPN
uniref:disease resistance protein RUN1-like n=1 Tax=Erigeron canadensis TaxID=72917 RepID=UPI001CB8EB88|nr:disease resistance protein RUN1-like [Erigeron canadensis]